MPVRQQETILVCEDESGLREMLGVLLRRADYHVVLCGGVREALETIRKGLSPDAVITDLLMPDGSGLDVLDTSVKCDPGVQVLMITAHATTEKAVDAMRRGAYDYIQKPFKNHELLATLEKALEKRRILEENASLKKRVAATEGSSLILGKSEAIRRIISLIERVADAPTSVLVTGESGTGKEIVARAIHASGQRASQPFVAVNCGALPENLMESELFGHERGAFTGAHQKKAGLFRSASAGTLFLDEVGELTPSLQVKLLRVLQERKVRPLGSEVELPVRARIIAATNRNLDEEVSEGRFRQDLFFRLNVIRIDLPPLRERKDDICLLAAHFVSKHAKEQGKSLSLDPGVFDWLESRAFPGNVRELENLMERAVTLAVADRIYRDDLDCESEQTGPDDQAALAAGAIDLDAHLAEIEKQILQEALLRAGGVRTAAASLVGMSFRSFRYRLAKYGIDDNDSSSST